MTGAMEDACMEKGLSRPALEVDSTASPPITSTTICTNDGSSPSVDAQDLPRSESIRDETSTCHDSGAAVRMKSDKMPVEASDLESVAPLVRGTEDTLPAGKTVLSSPVRTTSESSTESLPLVVGMPASVAVGGDGHEPPGASDLRDSAAAGAGKDCTLESTVSHPSTSESSDAVLAEKQEGEERAILEETQKQSQHQPSLPKRVSDQPGTESSNSCEESTNSPDMDVQDRREDEGSIERSREETLSLKKMLDRAKGTIKQLNGMLATYEHENGRLQDYMEALGNKHASGSINHCSTARNLRPFAENRKPPFYPMPAESSKTFCLPGSNGVPGLMRGPIPSPLFPMYGPEAPRFPLMKGGSGVFGEGPRSPPEDNGSSFLWRTQRQSLPWQYQQPHQMLSQPQPPASSALSPSAALGLLQFSQPTSLDSQGSGFPGPGASATGRKRERAESQTTSPEPPSSNLEPHPPQASSSSGEGAGEGSEKGGKAETPGPGAGSWGESQEAGTAVTLVSDGKTDEKRFRKSCDFCTATKIRCDGRKPTCENCDKRLIACHYSEKKRPGPKLSNAFKRERGRVDTRWGVPPASQTEETHSQPPLLKEPRKGAQAAQPQDQHKQLPAYDQHQLPQPPCEQQQQQEQQPLHPLHFSMTAPLARAPPPQAGPFHPFATSAMFSHLTGSYPPPPPPFLPPRHMPASFNAGAPMYSMYSSSQQHHSAFPHFAPHLQSGMHHDPSISFPQGPPFHPLMGSPLSTATDLYASYGNRSMGTSSMVNGSGGNAGNSLLPLPFLPPSAYTGESGGLLAPPNMSPFSSLTTTKGSPVGMENLIEEARGLAGSFQAPLSPLFSRIQSPAVGDAPRADTEGGRGGRSEQTGAVSSLVGMSMR